MKWRHKIRIKRLLTLLGKLRRFSKKEKREDLKWKSKNVKSKKRKLIIWLVVKTLILTFKSWLTKIGFRIKYYLHMYLVPKWKYKSSYSACCLCEEKTHFQKGRTKWRNRFDLSRQPTNQNTWTQIQSRWNH